jgi:hypothetical protein
VRGLLSFLRREWLFCLLLALLPLLTVLAPRPTSATIRHLPELLLHTDTLLLLAGLLVLTRGIEAGLPHLWVAFHGWSLAALAVATAIGWLMLDAVAPG